jgi:hypothetical protein
MKRMVISMTMGTMLLVPVGRMLAQDNEINERQRNQQKRIGEGVENGTLSAGEAARLEKQEVRIHNEVKTERQANGGSLTPRERRVGGVVRRASFFHGVRLFTSSRRPLTGTWSYVLECPSAGTQQSPAGFRRRSS